MRSFFRVTFAAIFFRIKNQSCKLRHPQPARQLAGAIFLFLFQSINLHMIARTVLISLFVFPLGSGFCQKAAFSRADFYLAISSDKLETISEQQEIAKATGNIGFEGALLMKKAGLVKKVGEKLSLFKEGHKLLDEAIKKDELNAELRFLRLMIQEHAPGILKYKGDIDSDSAFLLKNFNQLQPETQKAVISYSKTSRVLKPGDFNGS